MHLGLHAHKDFTKKRQSIILATVFKTGNDTRFPVADPEFHNGGRTVEGEGSGEGAVPPPQKKFEFLPENGGYFSAF